MHGKQAERHAARVIVGIGRFQEPDHAFLDEFHGHIFPKVEGRGNLEDQGLVRRHEAAVRRFIASRFCSPQGTFLLGGQQCDFFSSAK